MEICSFLISDHAEVREGLLFINGGGVTRVRKPTLPASLQLYFSVVISVAPDEIDQVHEVTISIVHADTAQEIFRTTAALQFAGPPENARPGEVIQLPLVFDTYSVLIKAAGNYDAKLIVDGAVPQDRGFSVIEASPFQESAG